MTTVKVYRMNLPAVKQNQQAEETFFRCTLGSLLRELREQRLGLTQDKIAARFQCDKDLYRGWEKGRGVPSGQAMIKILALCRDEAPEMLDQFLGLSKLKLERESGDRSDRGAPHVEIKRKRTPAPE